jgi:hypothetical protein
MVTIDRVAGLLAQRDRQVQPLAFVDLGGELAEQQVLLELVLEADLLAREGRNDARAARVFVEVLSAQLLGLIDGLAVIGKEVVQLVRLDRAANAEAGFDLLVRRRLIRWPCPAL